MQSAVPAFGEMQQYIVPLTHPVSKRPTGEENPSPETRIRYLSYRSGKVYIMLPVDGFREGCHCLF
jgi:hypothetical protein